MKNPKKFVDWFHEKFKNEYSDLWPKAKADHLVLDSLIAYEVRK